MKERELRAKLEALDSQCFGGVPRHSCGTTSNYAFRRSDGTLISGRDLVREAQAGNGGAA